MVQALGVCAICIVTYFSLVLPWIFSFTIALANANFLLIKYLLNVTGLPESCDNFECA